MSVVRPAGTGADETAVGTTTWLLEGRTENTLLPFLHSDDSAQAIAPSFRSGPVFVTLVRGGFVEPRTGLAFTRDRQLVAESAMKQQIRDALAARYGSIDFSAASSPPDGRPRFVVSNQRTANYCRWWLDQVSKYFIFEAARDFHAVARADMRYLSGPVTARFQQQTLSALDLSAQTDVSEAPLLQGDIYVSSGLTFAGGQNISGQVTSFRRFVLDRFDRTSGAALPTTTPARFYVSRARTRMRRMLNEEELEPILERNGFAKLVLEDLSVAEQIALFRGASTIVSPHGAGLTNVIFCRPGARILEIFPRGGLHPSAFMRLASLCGLGYGYLCGDSVENQASAKNANNADIVCPPDRFEAALSAIATPEIAGSVRSVPPNARSG